MYGDSETLAFYKRGLIFLALVGGLIGIGYGLAAVLLIRNMAGEDKFENIGMDLVRGPALLCGIVSLGMGYVVGLIAEARGFGSVLSVAFTAICMFGAAALTGYTAIPDLPMEMIYVFLVGAAAMTISGGFRLLVHG